MNAANQLSKHQRPRLCKSCMRLFMLALCCGLFGVLKAQQPVGQWKKVSHNIDYDGQQMDSYKSLLQVYPVAAQLVHEFSADGVYKLLCKGNNCADKYVLTQQKLYANMKWRITGNIIMMSSTGFSVGQSYKIQITGNKMTWVGTEGQGTIVYQKI